MSDFEHVFDTGDSGWTLILLHGTGGGKDDLVPLGRQLLPGAAILSPDGKVLENGVSRRFFKRLAVGELDIPDLIAQTDDLAAFLTSSVERYSLDPRKLIALGLSNGANIAVSLLFRHPGFLNAAALLRPMLPYQPDAGLDLTGTGVLIAAGGRDHYVPSSESVSLGKALEASGADVFMHLNPEAGHGLTEGDLVETSRWLLDRTSGT